MDTTQGYAALIIGARAVTLLLRLLGKNPLGGEASYLPQGVLISYWLTITIPSLLVTAAASIVGAVLLATNRSVLTAGVMIALALLPSATITGMALVSGEIEMAGKGLLRWTIEIGFISVLSMAIFKWKYASVHRRDMI